MFLVNVPVAAAGFACAIQLVPDSRNPAAQRPDLAGAVLSITGQVGGALGVAVVGSLLSTRCQDQMIAALARAPVPVPVPHAIRATITGSVGDALGVAAQAGGTLGRQLTVAARSAFLSGGDLGMLTAAIVVIVGCALALVTVPSRPGRGQADGRR